MDSSSSSGHDRVPPAIRSVLNLDIKLTKKFVNGVERIFPVLGSSTGITYMKALEVKVLLYFKTFQKQKVV